MVDLAKAHHAAFEGSTYGSVPAKAGNKTLESGKQIAGMRKAVEVMKKGGFTGGCGEVNTPRKRFTDSQVESK